MTEVEQLAYNAVWIAIYLITLFTFLGAVTALVISRVRSGKEKQVQYNLTFLHIMVPSLNEVEIKVAEQLFSGLMGFRKSFWKALVTGQHRISFEIVSKAEGIGFYVVVPDELVGLVERQINGAYPDAEIDIINPNEVWDRGKYTVVAELRLAGAPYFPIKTYESLGADALNAITSSMSKMADDEVLAVQFVVAPAGENWRRAGQRFIGDANKRASNPQRSVPVDSAFLDGIGKKLAKPGFEVVVRLVSIARDQITAENHIQSVATSFEQFTDVTFNKFKRRSFVSGKKLINDFIYRRINVHEWHIPFLDISLYKNTATLNVEELATVFHFPNKNVQTPNIIWLTARKAAAPVNLPKEGLYLGDSVFRGQNTPVYLKTDDRRRHMYIIGQTGTGKSVLLNSLVLQDIKAGKGVALIDPHGSDIDELLEKIPPERAEDVILFDVSDIERPLGLNILEAETEEQKNMMINAFIALLYKLYDPNHQGIMGPQLERAIRNTMLTAMVDKESTLVDVLRLMIDTKYSEKFLPHLTDPLVKRYWTDEMAKTTDYHKSEKTGYIVSKFDRFVTEKFMRNIIGQPRSAIDFSKIMAEKKILLVDLSKGKIGEENSNFLGLILVPRILAAAMGRHVLLGKEDFPDFYLYVDEFQNFATPDFATILSEARKYKLNLTVANQFIGQLTDEIRDAVFGNVGTLVSFRVGTDDAEYLEKQLAPVFKSADLINNSVGNSYVRLLIDGHPSVPFSMKINKEKIDSVQKNPQTAQRIRELSRLKYGVPAQEVELYINERAGFTQQDQSQSQKLPGLGGFPF